MKRVSLLLSMAFFAFSSVAKADDALVLKNLQRLLPDADMMQVNPSPIDGLYEVIIGTDVIYATGDARFIFKGDLIDTIDKSNLSETLRARSRASLLKTIPDQEYIEFAADDGKDVIYVFTDVDCGYCRQLHMDVKQLNAASIDVRYLAYPRSGIKSPTYKTMVDIWCAEDRAMALTDAKRGRGVKQVNDCINPVAKQYALGKQMGVRGTPAIFLENGVALPGYVPPSSILKVIGR